MSRGPQQGAQDRQGAGNPQGDGRGEPVPPRWREMSKGIIYVSNSYDLVYRLVTGR
jgi:hypothetical protein